MPQILVVQAEIAELARVNEWVDALVEQWNLPQSTSFAIHLCLEEAISNIVFHGFSGAEGVGLNKDLRLSFANGSDAVTLTIEDHGVAFDPLKVAAPILPTTISEATVGGLGIHLMRKFAQHLKYERQDGMNRLALRFDLSKVGD